MEIGPLQLLDKKKQRYLALNRKLKLREGGKSN